VANDTPLIVQVPRGSMVHDRLTGQPPPSVTHQEVVVEVGPSDAEGNLEASDVGHVVLAVPSPETLEREPDEVHRVIAEAGEGSEPLIVVVEVAEELREEELAPVLEAAAHSPRAVILRVIRDA
jgi:hypothetical protein